MAVTRPEIFVSAVTTDLCTCRGVVKEALLTMGCTPVEQANFPPHAGQVRKMLRGKIAGCQAVVHIVGEAYGSEPVERGGGEPSGGGESFSVVKQANFAHQQVVQNHESQKQNATNEQGSGDATRDEAKHSTEAAQLPADTGWNGLAEIFSPKGETVGEVHRTKDTRG